MKGEAFDAIQHGVRPRPSRSHRAQSWRAEALGPRLPHRVGVRCCRWAHWSGWVRPNAGLLLFIAAHKQVQASTITSSSSRSQDPRVRRQKAFVKVQSGWTGVPTAGPAPLALILTLRQQVQFQSIAGWRLMTSRLATPAGERKMACGAGRKLTTMRASARPCVCRCDVERHTGPPPVGNLGAPGPQRSGLAVGADTGHRGGRHRLTAQLPAAYCREWPVCSGFRASGLSERRT